MCCTAPAATRPLSLDVFKNQNPQLLASSTLRSAELLLLFSQIRHLPPFSSITIFYKALEDHNPRLSRGTAVF
ncbi:unnamed protein product [Coffea canephora]|uniref:Uncharacterized protein n=1 Tax=Coffea canephora TaxID=49390 RepID=A0A068UY53_COFCA|nr:unnamed protein product [Coffea canephora]